MLTYKSVLGEIRCCEGEIITIIKDSSAINDDFISLLANDLKEYFNIQYSYDNLSDEKNLDCAPRQNQDLTVLKRCGVKSGGQAKSSRLYADR